MDIERLIQEVRARPAIWDQKVTAYYNRDIVCNTWKEIAQACDMPCEAVRCKWKHLRDNFRKEFKKCAKEAGVGTDPEKFQSGWVWYNNLRFLGDQLVTRKTNPYRKFFSKAQDKKNKSLSDGNSEDTDMMPDVESEMYLEDNSQSLYIPPIATLNEGKATEIEFKYDDLKKFSDSAESNFEIKKTKRKRSKNGHGQSDDTYHFLMSLMNPIKSLSYDRQMYVRLKIQELIFSETISSHSQQPYPVELKSIEEGSSHTASQVVTSDGSSDTANFN